MWKAQSYISIDITCSSRISTTMHIQYSVLVADLNTGDACGLLLDPRVATWDRMIRMPALNPMHCYRPWKWEPLVVSSFSVLGYVYHRLTLYSPGSTGLVYGGIAGVIRSPHPVIHSISCGIHWSVCGSSFWCQFLRSFPLPLSSWYWDWIATGLRSNILKLHYQDNASPKQRSYVSALSGGIAGGGVTRLMGIHSTDR